MVQEQMELDGALGLAKVSPGEKAQAQVDDRGIEAEELVLEAELPIFTRAFAATEVQQQEEGILIKLPGTVGVGIGKGALGWSGAQAKMIELAAGDGQAVADLPEALGLGQLAEKHRDILAPGREALGVALRPSLMDQPLKQVPRNDLENLAEQACGKLHGGDSFEVFGALQLSFYFEESLCYRSA